MAQIGNQRLLEGFSVVRGERKRKKNKTTILILGYLQVRFKSGKRRGDLRQWSLFQSLKLERATRAPCKADVKMLERSTSSS